MADSVSYRTLCRRRFMLLLLLLLALILATLLSLKIGPYRTTFGATVATLLGQGDDQLLQHLLFSLRLPRTVAAILAGAGLAISGCLMQSLLRNPLASPSTLGISQGAAFGAACVILLSGQSQPLLPTELVHPSFMGRSLVVLGAFAGASLSGLVIMLLTLMRRLGSEALILAGVALASFFTACTMLLQYFGSDTQVAATLFWTFGDLGKGGWTENLTLLLLLIPVVILLLLDGWNLNSLQWGEELARSMGVNSRGVLFRGVGIASLLAAVITSFLGIIPFVGLMAPHLVRPLFGGDQRYQLPASALAGGLLLLLADLLSRTIIAPVVIPVGIVTSFAGAPLFLFLLLRRGRDG